MKQPLAELLTQNYGEIRDDYSGRFMFGQTTHAVVYENHQQFMECLTYAAFQLGKEYVEGDYDGDQHRMVEELARLRQDSMGLGIVVY